MKKLNLKVASNSNIDAYFLVDGKRLKGRSKKDNFGNLCKVVEVENDVVEIRIFDWNEMQGKLWLLTSFVFFVISIFGLLDVRVNKNCRSIDCKLNVKLNSENSNLKIAYNKFQNGEVAVKFDGDCDVEVVSNRYYINEECKKRFKIMKWIKIATVVVAIIGVILFLNK